MAAGPGGLFFPASDIGVDNLNATASVPYRESPWLPFTRKGAVVEDAEQARIMDPGRGQFTALTKKGEVAEGPPTRREPVVDRVTNPRGVRHPTKTFQDSQPVADRARYQEWLARQGRKTQ